jgi:hypothetical protein
LLLIVSQVCLDLDRQVIGLDAALVIDKDLQKIESPPRLFLETICRLRRDSSPLIHHCWGTAALLGFLHLCHPFHDCHVKWKEGEKLSEDQGHLLVIA